MAPAVVSQIDSDAEHDSHINVTVWDAAKRARSSHLKLDHCYSEDDGAKQIREHL